MIMSSIPIETDLKLMKVDGSPNLASLKRPPALTMDEVYNRIRLLSNLSPDIPKKKVHEEAKELLMDALHILGHWELTGLYLDILEEDQWA